MVRPLLKPCDEDESRPLLESVVCSVVGAVLCVVGTLCELDNPPCEMPDAVLCVVGVEM